MFATCQLRVTSQHWHMISERVEVQVEVKFSGELWTRLDRLEGILGVDLLLE